MDTKQDMLLLDLGFGGKVKPECPSSDDYREGKGRKVAELPLFNSDSTEAVTNNFGGSNMLRQRGSGVIWLYCQKCC